MGTMHKAKAIYTCLRYSIYIGVCYCWVDCKCRVQKLAILLNYIYLVYTYRTERESERTVGPYIRKSNNFPPKYVGCWCGFIRRGEQQQPLGSSYGQSLAPYRAHHRPITKDLRLKNKPYTGRKHARGCQESRPLALTLSCTRLTQFFALG